MYLFLCLPYRSAAIQQWELRRDLYPRHDISESTDDDRDSFAESSFSSVSEPSVYPTAQDGSSLITFPPHNFLQANMHDILEAEEVLSVSDGGDVSDGEDVTDGGVDEA